jgi:hypothetical protein
MKKIPKSPKPKKKYTHQVNKTIDDAPGDINSLLAAAFRIISHPH